MVTFPAVLSHPSGQLLADLSRRVVALKQAIVRKDMEAILKGLDLALEDARDSDEAPGKPSRPIRSINHSDRRYWIRSRDGTAIPPSRLEQLETQLERELDWIGPVYRSATADGDEQMVCPAPNVLLLKTPPRGGAETKALAATLTQYGLREVAAKSKSVGPYHYCVIGDPQKRSVYELMEQLRKAEASPVAEVSPVMDARFEHIPMVKPTALVPNDPLYAQQWNMVRIGAGGAGTTGWDEARDTTVIAILDEGCDLTHPDLQFAEPGINLGTMQPDGSPTGPHGTACAGIAAAVLDNAEGVAGVARNCTILPIAFVDWTESEVAAGIRYAVSRGARVISMSFGWNLWDQSIIDPAIQEAFDAEVVMCAAAGNEDSTVMRYPSTNPLVIACGASDEADNRKSTTSPDGEWWGSCYGPALSVVAPGVHIPTTDIQGGGGYNNATGPAGNYVMTFNGTSAATPHVAGLAGLLLSRYPHLSNVQVRAIIERTAEKVGTIPYTTDPAHPNGTWHQEMGYGRINVLHALDLADVMIRDCPSDNGLEPSAPPGGDYWDYSDIVVRANDDGVFVPSDINQARNVERGQTNYVYVRLRNPGPKPARNVVVSVRITPFVGLQFVYPQDWTAVDNMHVSPTPVAASFATLAVGASVIAKFSLSAQQVESLWGWSSSNPWHPCLLASVTADNDYAYATADLSGNGLVVRRNNLAQRNLTVVDLVPGASVTVPLIAGHRFNRERALEILVDRSEVPREAKLMLSLDEPRKDATTLDAAEPEEAGDDRIVFLDRTRIETTLGGSRGVLIMEKGSSIDRPKSAGLQEERVEGGQMVLIDGKRHIDITGRFGTIRVRKSPGWTYPLSLRIQVPQNLPPNNRFAIRIAQKNEAGQIVGGAGIVCNVKTAIIKKEVERLVDRLQPQREPQHAANLIGIA